jgi:leucyl-tRNA synthetase
MHLLYIRFFTKVLNTLGVLPFDEPMERLFNQGMILGPDGEKMSKSRGNVINPDDVVGQYGADTVRGYLMFIGPWDQGGPWDPSAIEGISRFMYRVWGVVVEEAKPEYLAAEPSADEVRALERKLHQTIIKVTDDHENFRFNTAIAAMMELNNMLIKVKETAVAGSPIWAESIRSLALMMAPIFPHISEEMWHRLGNEGSVHVQIWPEGDAEKAKDDEVTVVVQINGKVRDKLAVAPGLSKDELERLALDLPNVQKWMGGKTARKVIVVPNKLVNVVVG